MMVIQIITLWSCLIGLTSASHFRGGLVTWSPVDAVNFDGRVHNNQIIIVLFL